MLSRVIRRMLITLKPQVKLFTPGPLNTTKTVKEAMLYDFGSRDPDFGRIIEDIKLKLLTTANVSPKDYAAVIVQGNGTYAVEAALGSSFPRTTETDHSRTMLVVANGAYGERMVNICEVLKIRHMVLRYADDEPANTEEIVRTLREHPSISHVAIVHSETTTGLLNPAAEIGKAIHAHNPEVTYLVDMMSSFGAIHLDPVENHIHYLISSSNKMLQGVPGFAFVLSKLAKLRQTKGNARSLSLDLYDQWDYQLSNPGQFRFTPPTHVLSAFYQAMLEFEAAGGVAARGQRYFNNQRVVSEMMQKMGFKLYINPQHQGCVITTFLEPKHPRFNFKTLYDYLAANNIVIYPGKLPKVPSFRIGNIGDLNEADMRQCMSLIKDAFTYMGIELPLRSQ